MPMSPLERLRGVFGGKEIARAQNGEPGGNFAAAWFDTMEFVDAELTSATTSRITYRFPVLHHYLNPTRTLHGGAIATIFDIGTSWTLFLISKPGFWMTMGTTRTLNCTYLRPAFEDEWVQMECEIVHCGKRMAFVKGTMLRESDRAILATCEHNKFNVDADTRV